MHQARLADRGVRIDEAAVHGVGSLAVAQTAPDFAFMCALARVNDKQKANRLGGRLPTGSWKV